MDFDSWLDDASLPETEVPLCLDGKLVRRYEQVKARVDARAEARAEAAKGDSNDVRLGAVEQPDPEQPELDRLAAQIQAKTRMFTLRAMDRDAFQELKAKYPPRTNPQTRQTEPSDLRANINTLTFTPILIQASIADPEMTDAQFERFRKKLTDIQVDNLAVAAWDLNREERDIPFSFSSSEVPESSTTA